MRIIIKCSGCGKELPIKEIQIDHEQNSIVHVNPCGTLDCNNCEGCEEVEAAEKLRTSLREIKDVASKS